jgi:LacI family transcriptional regulator
VVKARGRRAVNIKDVATHLKVSLSTVSRVFNDHPDVSQEMRERVLAGADELGYHPHFPAKSLRGGYTRTVGFVLRDLSNPIFADIVKGAEETMRRAGYAVILTNSEGDPAFDVRNIQVLDQRWVDGLLLSLQSEDREDLHAVLREIEVPIVLIDREVQGIEASIVRVDHQSGVCAAVGDLIGKGHRRIALIGGPRDLLATRARLEGYAAEHDERSVEIDTGLLRLGSYAHSFGYAQTIELMSLPRRPSAILAGSVQLTTGVLAACTELGIRPGKDLALVSCDDAEFMSFIDPPLSIVGRDALLMGRLAAELLLEMVVEGLPPREATVPTVYVPRGTSTDA